MAHKILLLLLPYSIGNTAQDISVVYPVENLIKNSGLRPDFF